uniref:Uncharacterized protein n=1 Tax=Myotis myotis TaxID=51298 RepID=A0A7J7RFL1_MYOMY|nr:hypothetical protein mMyoMyo1_010362 [Myotis myotis]
MFSCQRRELPLLPPSPFPLCCPHPRGGGLRPWGGGCLQPSPLTTSGICGEPCGRVLGGGKGVKEGVEVALGPSPPPPPCRLPPVRRGPARRPSIKGLFILDGCRGVGEGVGGGEGGGEVGVGGGRDWMGLQRGAERREKQKVTITKENTKRKKTKP